jgi:hypothetical protein
MQVVDLAAYRAQLRSAWRDDDMHHQPPPGRVRRPSMMTWPDHVAAPPTILVVEDDDLLRAVLVDLLAGRGAGADPTRAGV